MKYALILTVLSGGPDDETVILAAAELAKRQGALVKVLPSVPLAEAVVWADAFGATYVAGETVRAITEGQTRLRGDIAALARRAAERLGLKFGDPSGAGVVMVDDPGPPWMVLAQEAPLADLVVMGAETSRAEGFWGGLPGEALMRIRKPILVVRAPETIEGGVCAIAWDGSLQAGRAVRGALPLLGAASQVVILQDPEGLTPEEAKVSDPARLQAYLRLQGIEAAEVRTAMGRREGRALIYAAQDAGARLLVAGAFGHTRLGETLVGGATRSFIMAQDGPHLLLAH